jgi:hypothetical protein
VFERMINSYFGVICSGYNTFFRVYIACKSAI